jgi:membrane-bound lytic murein transglycosylase A
MNSTIKASLLSKTGLKISLVIIFISLIGVLCIKHLLFPTLEKEAASPEEALLRQRLFLPEFQDDMALDSLTHAIEKNLLYLDRIGPDHMFQYGSLSVSCKKVRETQEKLLEIVSGNPVPGDLDAAVKKAFTAYRATGRKGNRNVLFTGYFEPVYDGDLQPSDTYMYPLYKTPQDLLRIDLSPFGDQFKGKRILARLEGKKLLPYYSREDIEDHGALKDRGLEIAWMKDPVDVAFLHIQGSGCIRQPDGNIVSVGYAGSNGRPYRSIGRYMIDKGYMTREEMSMQAIRKYLRSHPEVVDEVLNHNPSYVFFRQKKNGPFGNINVRLTPGRSIALDSRLFPKGALCFITAEKPVVQGGEIESWVNFSRFVLNQDTGGAIKGAGRADIFWGRGPYAEIAAGHMKHEGELYVLLKKE